MLGFLNTEYLNKLVSPSSIILSIIDQLLIAIGTVFVAVSVYQVRRGISAGKLVTDGLYAYFRHPLYAGWILFIVPGIVLLSGLVLMILLPFLMYAFFRVSIRKEEDELERPFEEEYLSYKRRVNSIVPRLRK